MLCNCDACFKNHGNIRSMHTVQKKEDTYLGFELFQNTLCLSADTKQAPTLTAKHTNQTKSIVDLRNENLYSKTKPKKCTLLTL